MTAPEMIEISHVSQDELPAVEAIMVRAFDPRYGEAWSPAQCLAVLTMPGYALRIASGSRGITGFSVIRWVADESELLLLAVDPEARGRGVGTALLKDWMALAGKKGASRYFLEMRTDNPAKQLYARLGFTEVGLRTGYYRGADERMRDAITMQKLSSDLI
jgi:[ribosomal protein S18]-alanine N-acetyltransferase